MLVRSTQRKCFACYIYVSNFEESAFLIFSHGRFNCESADARYAFVTGALT